MNGLLDSQGAKAKGVGDLSNLFDNLCLEACFFPNLSQGCGVELFPFFLVTLGDYPVLTTTPISVADESDHARVIRGNN
jgi:hypothetical protein